jgi:hypothetical protein
LETAVEAVTQQGLSFREAARLFGVPISTIHDKKHKGKYGEFYPDQRGRKRIRRRQMNIIPVKSDTDATQTSNAACVDILPDNVNDCDNGKMCNKASCQEDDVGKLNGKMMKRRKQFKYLFQRINFLEYFRKWTMNLTFKIRKLLQKR